MTSSAKKQALQRVKEAKRTVLAALRENGELLNLQELYLFLNQTEDILSMAAIDEQLANLQSAQKKLEDITRRIKEDIEGLEDVAEKVEIATKAVKGVTDAFKTIA